MKAYTVMAKMSVDINRTIYAESLTDATLRAVKLNVTDFVRPAKGAADVLNDFDDFKVYGVFEE